MTSHRHHFLPKFYLDGFTNPDGKLVVYDAINRRIEKRDRHPAGIFYKMDRNSVNINGKLESIPEEIYSRIETQTSGVFQKIQDTIGVPRLSATDKQGLQVFISDLFWRNPKTDRHYEETFRNTRFLKKFLSARDAKTGDPLTKGISNSVLEDENTMSKLMRPMAGILSFEQSQPDFTHWRISYSAKNNYICSDNPLLLADENATDIFHSEFIFPLTKNHLLIKSFEKKQIREFPGEIAGLTQLALFLQSREHCAASQLETLTLLRNVERNYSVDFLKDRIFGFIHSGDQ